MKLHFEASQSKTVHTLFTPCSLNTIDLLTIPSRVGHIVLRSLAPYTWQNNKSYSFLFHPKLCLHVSIWNRGQILATFSQNVSGYIKLRKFSSVQFSCSVVSDSLQPHESQHTRPPCSSPTPGIYSNTCPSSR